MSDAKFDFLLVAIILSAALHGALMYWARPRVMTHTEPPPRVERHHGPMKVTPAPTTPAPVGFTEVKDQVAERPAPDAKESIAAIFAPPPGSVAETTKPAVPETPRVIERLRPVEGPTVLPAVQQTAAPTPTTRPRMAVEAPAPVAAAAGPAPAAPMKVAIAVKPPEPVEAPAVVARAAKTPTERIEQIAAEAKPAFKPSAQVYAEVDEDIVRREKEAVRDLMSVENASDMNDAVFASLVTAEEGGYTYFKATIRPRPRLPVVPKDVVILIDASGSIGNTRLKSCREAARKILRTCTNSGDRFNLVAFRNRFSYAFLTWRDCDKASFTAADGWLDGLAAHGRTDVFSTIRSVLTLPRDPARPLIALVVTDGDANEGVSDTPAIISKFTKLNDGLISVYMYGVRRSGNRELIDMLTRGNRGESLMFDGLDKAVSGGGIEKLSERFRDPVLTDLRVVFPTTCPAEAYPTLLKNLYRGDSVEIVGRIAGAPKTIDFSLRGLAGPIAYDGIFRLPPAAGVETPSAIVKAWQDAQAFDKRY